MDYQFKSYSKNSKKKSLPIYLIFIPFVLWIAYMGWSISLHRRVVMFEWFPKWTISITFAVFLGMIGGIWSIFRRPIKHAFKNFLSTGVAGFVLIVPAFDVLTYLLSVNTIRYQTEYKITSPGPRTNRFGRCEHGIWIKEIYTERGALFCISDPKSKTQKNTGTLWVTTMTGPIGSYIVDYQFTPFNS